MTDLATLRRHERVFADMAVHGATEAERDANAWAHDMCVRERLRAEEDERERNLPLCPFCVRGLAYTRPCGTCGGVGRLAR